MITIIVAYDEAFVIGNKGEIPWRLPEDMKHFKEITCSFPVIMGRNTYLSLPDRFRPLPGRHNIVISRSAYFPEVTCVRSLEEAVAVAAGDCFIIGGGQVYREAIRKGLVDRVIASEVKGTHDGDVFFLDLKSEGWIGEMKKQFDQFNVVEYHLPG